MALDFLSGATGALGLGGGVAGSSAGETQSSTSSLQQTITPRTDIQSGAGARGAVTINTAFPGAGISSSSDVNPTNEPSIAKMSLIAAGAIVGLILLTFAVKKG